MRNRVLSYCLEGNVIQPGLFDGEVESFGGGLSKDQQFSAGSESQDLGWTSLAVGPFEWAFVSGFKSISIGIKLSTGRKFQIFLLGLATSVEEGSWGEIQVEIVDKVEDIASIELEGTDLPVTVKSGVKPSVGLQVENDILVEAVKLVGLGPSIEAEWLNSYSKEPGLVGTVMSHRCS